METLDLLGIGVGPFNLSLAALAEPIDVNTLFLERKTEFSWHPGMLLPNGRLQVSSLKDCVTLADPTSRYSFLNYLAKHRRLYGFVNKRSQAISRLEFASYYQWVAKQLPNLRFGEGVVDVEIAGDHYRVRSQKNVYRTRSLSIGVGIAPRIPAFAEPWLCDTVYHAVDYMHRCRFSYDEHVLVVGGGQSGAEVVEHLLENPTIAKITWVTARDNLFAMDDNAFVNEAYSPAYCETFQSLPLLQRRQKVFDERLTSDGISPDLCDRLYEKLYDRLQKESDVRRVRILPSVRMEAMEKYDVRWHVDLASVPSGMRRKIEVDRIILATGYKPSQQPFIDKLLRNARREQGMPLLDKDYAVQFDKVMPGPIYLQNRSLNQHGLQSVNLSLVAYRNSLILNHLLGVEYYPSAPDHHVFSRLEELEFCFEIPVGNCAPFSERGTAQV